MAIYNLAEDNWDSSELDALQRVIESKRYTMGKEVHEFERDCESLFGSRNCIMVNSGSSANFVMLAAWKWLEGDSWPDSPEVIVPAVSWSTTYNPLYFLGIKPVFVDINLESLCIDERLIESAITERTIGVFVVNVLGNPASLLRITEICNKHNIRLFEDNCESLGATINGRFTGSFGFASSQSSFYSHHISTMEGGWILTNNDEFADVCRSIRAHGWIRELKSDWARKFRTGDETVDRFVFVTPGLNFRPLEFQGAVGIAQLKKLPEMLRLRRNNAKLFREGIADFPQLNPQQTEEGSSWFAFSMVATSSALSRSNLFRCLSDTSIEARPVIAGDFTKQPVMSKFIGRTSGSLPNASKVHDYGLYVGNHARDLTNELGLLFQTLRGFFN